MAAQPPDQELVLFLEGQKGPSYWGPLLLLLSVWDDRTGIETHRSQDEETNPKNSRGKAHSFLRGACSPSPPWGKRLFK